MSHAGIKQQLNKLGTLLFMCLYTLISLYPLVWMLFYSLKSNEEIFVTNPFGFPYKFRFENYITAVTKFPIPKYFFNSLVITLGTIIITMLVSTLFAYASARMRWKFSGYVTTYMSLGMFIPAQLVMIPLIVLVRDLHILNTYSSLILPYAAFNLSFMIILLYGFFRNIPFEMEESAYLEGAGIVTIIVKIIVPLIVPGIVTACIFLFLNVWNEFFFAYVMVSDESIKTISVGLANFQGIFSTNWGALGAGLTIASLPTVIVYLLFSEGVESAISVGSAVKG